MVQSKWSCCPLVPARCAGGQADRSPGHSRSVCAVSQQSRSHSSSLSQHFPKSYASEGTNAVAPSLWQRLHPTPDASAASALRAREEMAISPHVTHHRHKTAATGLNHLSGFFQHYTFYKRRINLPHMHRRHGMKQWTETAMRKI